MHNKKEICDRIKAMYPELGECGVDVTVDFNDQKKCWIVDLKKDEHELTTHLDPHDADVCLDGKECVHLGTQISQLVENVKKA